MAMPSSLVGLKFGDFTKSLTKETIETMTKLLASSTKFIHMKEVKTVKSKLICHSTKIKVNQEE